MMDMILQSAAIVSAIGVLAGLAGWLLWPRLKAFLVKEIVNPVQETHQQVTVNGGKNDPPTLPDQLSSIRKELVELRRNDEAQAAKDRSLETTVGALTLVLDEHLRWSREWTAGHGGDTPTEM